MASYIAYGKKLIPNETSGGGSGIIKITVTDNTYNITPHQLIDIFSAGNLAAVFEVVNDDPEETNNSAFISIVTTVLYTGSAWRMLMIDPEEGGSYYREASGYDEPFIAN